MSSKGYDRMAARRDLRRSSAAWRAIAGMAMLGALLVAPDEVAAQSAGASYAGKQIRMVIGSGAGGGYDTYARVLTRHLGRHIAGNPAIINQNMPSAAGMAEHGASIT